jgi:hypothetical protein
MHRRIALGNGGRGGLIDRFERLEFSRDARPPIGGRYRAGLDIGAAMADRGRSVSRVIAGRPFFADFSELPEARP